MRNGCPAAKRRRLSNSVSRWRADRTTWISHRTGIWATLRFAHKVAVIDPASGQYQTIEVGRSPHGIWLNTHDALAARITERESH